MCYNANNRIADKAKYFFHKNDNGFAPLLFFYGHFLPVTVNHEVADKQNPDPSLFLFSLVGADDNGFGVMRVFVYHEMFFDKFDWQ